MKTRLKTTIIVGIFLLLFTILDTKIVFSQDYSRFGIIGDTRIGMTEHRYIHFLNRIQKDSINVIFNTGDAIDKPGREDQFKRFLEISKDFYINIAPGNHDINDQRSLDIYRRVVNKAPYYSFSENDAHFIMLCTDLPDEIDRITGKQLIWLKEELKKPFKYRFIFMHKPMYPPPFIKRLSLNRHPEERDALHELFKKNNVSSVIAGHEHLYYRTEKDGIVYVITGGGGGHLSTRDEKQGGFFHYIIAKKMNEGYLFMVYDMDDKIRDRFHIKK